MNNVSVFFFIYIYIYAKFRMTNGTADECKITKKNYNIML